MAGKGAARKERPAESGTAAPPAAARRNYVVFARRFRPQSFGEVVGQETVTASLKLALRSGRLAHAWLLTGPRGVGKTTLARILAKALNCEAGSGPGGTVEEPCNACPACRSIQEGSALDVIEMDAATHRGIEDVRELRDNVGLAPAQFRFKVYIVDEVHMLTNEAWNAFLKTLEEPPPHVKFVFATTDPDRIPETILSRCQRHDLRRIGLGDIRKRLRRICEMEKIEIEEAALDRLALLARGGLRDAEGLLDQAVNLAEGRVTDEIVRRLSGAAPDELLFEILEACADGKTAAALARAHAALEAGADPADLLAAVCERLRATLLLKTCGADSSLLEGLSFLQAPAGKLAARLSEDQCLMLLQLFSAAQRHTKDALQVRLPLEMALVRASRAGELTDLGRLVAALESGAASKPAPNALSPPAREGPRPNGASRPAEAAKARSAAEAPAACPPAAPAAPPAPALSRPERWEECLAQVQRLNGGPMLLSALTHAAGIRLDSAAGTLELAYSPAQGFYREALEKRERSEAFRQALEKTYGRPLAVAFVVASSTPQGPARASASLPAAPTVSSASSRAGAATAAPQAGEAAGAKAREEVEETEEAELEETEVEFQDEGALPLEAAPVAEAVESEPPAASPSEEDLGPPSGPVGTAPSEVAAREAAESAAADPSEALQHPLVQLLLARVEGEVVRFEKEVRREGARHTGS